MAQHLYFSFVTKCRMVFMIGKLNYIKSQLDIHGVLPIFAWYASFDFKAIVP